MPEPSYVMPTARAIWEVLDLRPKLRGYKLNGQGWIFIDGEQTALKWDDVSVTAAMPDLSVEFFCVFPQVNADGAEYIVPRFDIKVPRAKLDANANVLEILEKAFGKGRIALHEKDQRRAIFQTTQRREVSRDEISSRRWSLWYRDRLIWAVGAMEELFGVDGSVN